MVTRARLATALRAGAFVLSAIQGGALLAGADAARALAAGVAGGAAACAGALVIAILSPRIVRRSPCSLDSDSRGAPNIGTRLAPERGKEATDA